MCKKRSEINFNDALSSFAADSQIKSANLRHFLLRSFNVLHGEVSCEVKQKARIMYPDFLP